MYVYRLRECMCDAMPWNAHDVLMPYTQVCRAREYSCDYHAVDSIFRCEILHASV